MGHGIERDLGFPHFREMLRVQLEHEFAEMSKRGVHFSQRRRATLTGYAPRFNKVSSTNPREGKVNIVENENEMIERVLYEFRESDLMKLHAAETCPAHYMKVSMLGKKNPGGRIQAHFPSPQICADPVLLFCRLREPSRWGAENTSRVLDPVGCGNLSTVAWSFQPHVQ